MVRHIKIEEMTCPNVSTSADGLRMTEPVQHATSSRKLKHLFPAGPDTVAGICGPPGLVNFAALPGLKKLGYQEEQCIVF